MYKMKIKYDKLQYIKGRYVLISASIIHLYIYWLFNDACYKNNIVIRLMIGGGKK